MNVLNAFQALCARILASGLENRAEVVLTIAVGSRKVFFDGEGIYYGPYHSAHTYGFFPLNDAGLTNAYEYLAFPARTPLALQQLIEEIIAKAVALGVPYEHLSTKVSLAGSDYVEITGHNPTRWVTINKFGPLTLNRWEKQSDLGLCEVHEAAEWLVDRP